MFRKKWLSPFKQNLSPAKLPLNLLVNNIFSSIMTSEKYILVTYHFKEPMNPNKMVQHSSTLPSSKRQF